MTTTLDDDFADLDALLGEALAADAAGKAARAAADRRKRGVPMASGEAAADAAIIAEWEARNVWRAVANVACFQRVECACGGKTAHFIGLMSRSVHRHLHNGEVRYLAIPAALADLPNETAVQVVQTAICGVCAEYKGWDLNAAKEI